MRSLLRPLVGTLLAVAVVLAVAACGSDGDGNVASTGATDRVAFTTELVHRDAATLALLDASLGAEMPPGVSTTVETVRLDASTRIETAKDLFEEWGEEIPVTVRDHGVDHGVEVDPPQLPGAPTPDEIHALKGAEDFERQFTALLAESLSSTEEAAAEWGGDDAQATDLATDAEQQSRTALDALG